MEVKKCCSSLHLGDRVVSLQEFGVNSRSKDGYSSVCKICTNRAFANRRASNPDRYKANSKRYYEGHKQSYADRKARSLLTHRGTIIRMLAQARNRAQKTGMVFDLEEGDITIPSTCPVLGIPLLLGARKSEVEQSPSLDRIDPSLGYQKDNVVVVSWRANRLKSDATKDELKRLYEYYTKT